MQKESLFGRTLTLKLKTESFEVRTRAMSLHKYIQSKEDILSHATRLLKSELPLSVRLIGLRMSHFRDTTPGCGDPMQKTLTSFVIPGEASQSVLHVNHSAGSDTSGDLLVCNEICFSDDTSELHQGYGHPEVVHEQCFDNDADKMKEFDGDENSAKTKEMESSSCTESLVGKEEVVNETGKSLDKGVVFSSAQEELVFWIDDYICSLCGCELPQSFVEERQEHSDYHLAEMLQKEEAMNNSVLVQERPAQQASRSTGSARKKQKPSSKGSRHIPIDLFFERSKKV